MSWPDCPLTLTNVEELLTSNAGAAAEVRQLVASGDGAAALTACFLKWARPELRDHIRAELGDLPGHVVTGIVHAWLFAEAATQPFRLRAAYPASPLEMARKRRVELTVAMDEDGVLVTLAHMNGRHAVWYRPAAAA